MEAYQKLPITANLSCLRVPSQVALLLDNIQWVTNCESAFITYQGGAKDALEKCYDKQVEFLKSFVMLANDSSIEKCMRVKLNTLITMNIHHRDKIKELKDA